LAICPIAKCKGVLGFEVEKMSSEFLTVREKLASKKSIMSLNKHQSVASLRGGFGRGNQKFTNENRRRAYGKDLKV